MMRRLLEDLSRAIQHLLAGALLILMGGGCVQHARPTTGSAADSAPSLREARIAAAAAYVDSLRAVHGIPAVSAAVAVEGRVVWEYATGWSESIRGEAISSSSLFRIGSVSKLLTATAAVRLWERGVLDFDRPISELVPGVPQTEVPITARMLSGHLAGIRHYSRSEYVSQTAYPNVSASLSQFINDSLVARPGTRYAYSSYGYNLLGAVLERAAGREFRVLVREEVSSPLGLQRIIASEAAGVPQEVEYFYRTDSGELEETPFVDLSDRWPSGGYVASAGDLARFGSMIFGAVSDSARFALLTPMETAGGTSTGVAVGWRVGTDARGRRIAHHGGDAMGSRAFLLVYPEEAFGVAVLANLNFAPIGEAEVGRIAELLGF